MKRLSKISVQLLFLNMLFFGAGAVFGAASPQVISVTAINQCSNSYKTLDTVYIDGIPAIGRDCAHASESHSFPYTFTIGLKNTCNYYLHSSWSPAVSKIDFIGHPGATSVTAVLQAYIQTCAFSVTYGN